MGGVGTKRHPAVGGRFYVRKQQKILQDLDDARHHGVCGRMPFSEKNIIGKPLGLYDPGRKARDMSPISIQQKTRRNDRMPGV